MSLSVAMIVKNEEKYIYDCLESIKDVADEIVIVDTGCNDSTEKKIIYFSKKTFKDKFIKIIRYRWQNDFAKARNESLKHCTGDWIIFIDADERLDERFIDYINSVKKTKQKAAYHCIVRSYGNVQTIARSPRLFRNTKGIKFVNKIHEQIGPSLIDLGYKFFIAPVVIKHIGYDVDEKALKEKARRNLEILKGEKESDGIYYHFAESYLQLNDYANAELYFNRVIGSNLNNQIKLHAHCTLALIYLLRLDSSRLAIGELVKAEMLIPGMPEVSYTMAIMSEKSGDWPGAKKYYENTLQRNKINRDSFFQIIYDRKILENKIKEVG